MADNTHVRNWHFLEYAHVYLWLVKDMCWALHWKTTGTVMVIPTVAVAWWITSLQRKNQVTLVHNLAISVWISSNSLWMIAEFFSQEATLKPIAIGGFILGLVGLTAYYTLRLLQKKKTGHS